MTGDKRDVWGDKRGEPGDKRGVPARRRVPPRAERCSRPDPMLARPNRTYVTTLVLALTAPSLAQGDDTRPRTSSLSWLRMAGAESCVPTQELARLVEARLGRPVFVSASQADVSVEGRVEPNGRGAGFKAVLELRDARGAKLGVRELSRPDRSCEALRDPLALVIAVMIDPDAALHPAPSSPPPAPLTAPPPPPPEPAVATPAAIAPPPAPPPRPPATWALDVGASGATTLGLLPAPNVGIHASGLLTPPGFVPLEAYGAAWPSVTSSSGVASATFALAYAGGGLCPLRVTDANARALFYGCAVGELGVLSRSFSTGGASTQELYAAGGAEARLSVRLAGPFALRVGLRGVVPLLRPDTRVAGASLFQPSVVAGEADLGLGVLVP